MDNDVFEIINAKSKGFDDYDIGDIPFVTNGFTDNGIIGFVKPNKNDRVFYKNSICVSAFCEATVQTAPFLARGNGGSGLKVLVPCKNLSLHDLLLVAAFINKTHNWKYNYGRMVTRERLKKIIDSIDFKKLEKSTKTYDVKTYLPSINKKEKIKHNTTYRDFSLNELFPEIHEGDFHVSSILDEGEIPFISCVTERNGISGIFHIDPEKTFQNCITIASDGSPLTSYYHPYPFNAQDNVMVCKPDSRFDLSVLMYVLFRLKEMKWRFSYGRKCYKNKLNKIKISLPIKNDGRIDSEYITSLMKNCYGWNTVFQNFS